MPRSRGARRLPPTDDIAGEDISALRCRDIRCDLPRRMSVEQPQVDAGAEIRVIFDEAKFAAVVDGLHVFDEIESASSAFG